MKAVFGKIMILITALLISQNVLAKNIAFTIQGSVPNGGEDQFVNPLIQASSCLEKSGWETSILPSALHDRPDLLRNEINEKFKAGTLVPIPQGKTSEERYLAAVEKAVLNLKDGDQFLLRIVSHGLQCSSGGHCLEMSQVDEGGSFALETSKLIPILKKAKPGVHIAVDVWSCYSGAVIPEFADAGICASSYSTGDTVMFSCGGEDKIPMLGDLNVAYLCRNVPSKNGPVDVTKSIAGAEGASSSYCFEEANKKFNMITTLSSKTETNSFEKVFDALRTTETFPNQALSTDGPFWVIGQLSAFGEAKLTNEKLDKEICCNQTSDQWFDSTTKKINQLAKIWTKDSCSLSTTLTAFWKENKNTIDPYFKAIKSVQAANLASEDLITPFLTKDKLEVYDKNKNSSMVSSSLSDYIQADLEIAVKDNFDDIPADFREFYKKEQAVAIARILPIFDDMKAIKLIQTKIAKNNIEANKSYELMKKILVEKIVPMERKLYGVLKNSSEYKICIENNPAWLKAKKACADFKY